MLRPGHYQHLTWPPPAAISPNADTAPKPATVMAGFLALQYILINLLLWGRLLLLDSKTKVVISNKVVYCYTN